MTSAKASTAKRKKASPASRHLGFVLGEKRVFLKDLLPQELGALLAEQINRADLRDLAGFGELKQVLELRTDEGDLQVSSILLVESQGFGADHPLTLKSHVVTMCRGCLSQEITYRHRKSGQETTDWNVAKTWHPDERIKIIRESILLMRRYPSEAVKEDLLVEVTYTYTEASGQRSSLITTLSGQAIPLHRFCGHFGKRAPQIACDLLGRLAEIYQQTAEAFQRKARSMGEKADRRTRLRASIA